MTFLTITVKMMNLLAMYLVKTFYLCVLPFCLFFPLRFIIRTWML